MVRFVADGGETGTTGAQGLAPVTKLFQGTSRNARAAGNGSAIGTATGPRRTGSGIAGRAGTDTEGQVSARQPACETAAAGEEAARAEEALLRRLRAKPLSVSEADRFLREQDAPPGEVGRIIERLRGYGYLDDAVLAERLVHNGVTRKRHGLSMLQRTLTERGVPREQIEAALAELADDDPVRALEFAKSKARGMRSLDRETALRRLTGQLARRGFGGSVAFDAARRALDEGC